MSKRIYTECTVYIKMSYVCMYTDTPTAPAVFQGFIARAVSDKVLPESYAAV